MVFPQVDLSPRHPSQLYEAGLEGLVLLAVLWWFARRPRPRMAVSGVFLLGYGALRFLAEFYRQPDAHLGFIAFDWLTMGQLLCAPMIAGGVLLVALAYAGIGQKEARTGTGTLSVFGWQMRFDLRDGFPAVTTKKLHLRSIVHELLWFIAGDTNIKYLKDNGVSSWDEWADENGDLGPVYGHQWRSWPAPDGRAIDQLAGVLHSIRHHPDSRRHIVSAWNPAEVDDMALPPCHTMFQFYVAEGRLSCQLYQRSADIFLGVPFNIASYALLTHMVAQVCGLEAGDFVHTFGDAHLYLNHLEQADRQLAREPLPLPRLELNPAVDDLFAFTYDDIRLVGYECHPHIKAPVAV